MSRSDEAPQFMMRSSRRLVVRELKAQTLYQTPVNLTHPTHEHIEVMRNLGSVDVVFLIDNDPTTRC